MKDLGVGDRVVVVRNMNAGPEGQESSDLSEHIGKHGIITSNDGWGLCGVLLDDGTMVSAWNRHDLQKEKSWIPNPNPN